MFKSIRTSMIMMFVGLLLVTNALIGYYAVNRSEESLKSEAQKGIGGVVEETRKVVDSRLDAEIIFMEEVANNRIIDDRTTWDQKVSYLQKRADLRGYTVFAFVALDGKITRYDLKKSPGNAVGRDYFQKAKNGSPAVSDIILSSVTGEPIIVIAVPIIRNGKVIGVLNGVKPQTGLNGIVRDFKYGKTGKAYLINRSGIIMAHADERYVANQTNFLDLLLDDNALQAQWIKENLKTKQSVIGIHKTQGGREKITVLCPMEKTDWFVVATAEMDDVLGDLQKLQVVLLQAVFIIAILGIGVGYVMTRRLIKPLQSIAQTFDQIASGEMDKQIEPAFMNSKNEIGSLSRSFEAMREKIMDAYNEIQENNVELEKKVEVRTQELVEMNNDLSQSIGALKRTQAHLVESQKQMTVDSLFKWIAHHMNTPLGNVICSLTFLKMNLKEGDQADLVDRDEAMAIIEKNTNRMVRIIESLKKITLAEKEQSPEIINLKHFIQKNMSYIAEDTGENSMSLELNGPEHLLINTYKLTLLQVLTMMMENIMKHAYGAGQQQDVQISIFETETQVVIKVRDMGRGIDEFHRKMLFKTQLENLTSDFQIGHSMQIAYNQVVTKLCGDLYVEPVDEGACFVIELPREMVFVPEA